MIIQSWTNTVGDLVAEGATVEARCSSCATTRPCDLERVAASKGALYSLWNRTSPCRTPGCDGRTWFKATRPGSKAWVQLRDAPPHLVEPLHKAWAAGRTGQVGCDEIRLSETGEALLASRASQLGRIS